ncbi:MAG: hypothetical protein KGL39_24565 [Patescibacteria group bacterium]|nr:hypothetical protein [Patescibacteria group bacterium]
MTAAEEIERLTQELAQWKALCEQQHAALTRALDFLPATRWVGGADEYGYEAREKLLKARAAVSRALRSYEGKGESDV